MGSGVRLFLTDVDEVKFTRAATRPMDTAREVGRCRTRSDHEEFYRQAEPQGWIVGTAENVKEEWVQ